MGSLLKIVHVLAPTAAVVALLGVMGCAAPGADDPDRADTQSSEAFTDGPIAPSLPPFALRVTRGIPSTRVIRASRAGLATAGATAAGATAATITVAVIKAATITTVADPSTEVKAHHAFPRARARSDVRGAGALAGLCPDVVRPCLPSSREAPPRPCYSPGA